LPAIAVGTFGADVCARTAPGPTNAISNSASLEVIAILLIGEFLSFIQSKVPCSERVRQIGSNAFSKRHARRATFALAYIAANFFGGARPKN
jgi:hypothetical protein